MKKNILLSLVALFAVLFVTGCAKPPQQEIEAAQTALAAAEQAEANLYVADLFTAAQDSFAAAQAAIEAENGKSSFSRSYDRAAALLAFASQTAAEAQAQVETKKEEVRVANETLIAEAEAAIAAAQQAIAQAPRGKDGAVALVSIQEDNATAATTLEEAKLAHANGEFAKAHDLAQAALDKANGLLEELNTAAGKTEAAPRS